MNQQPNRYQLIPRVAPPRSNGTPIRRRYRLARVGPSPRSALGEDRHERLERAASVR
jgi:hypothetical protein